MYQDFNWTKVAEERNAILRQYEPLQPYIFLELAKKMRSEVFVDVGANIGAYSIFLSSLDCIQKVYSFEAAYDTFHELKENVRLNDQQGKINVFNKAVSNTATQARFGIAGKFSGANGILSTSFHESGKFIRETVVDCVPLDEAVAERSKNICVKIDVEGHESAVLAGAKSLLTGNRAIIQLENYAVGDLSLSNVLTSYGYSEIFSIGPDVYFTNSQAVLTSDAIIFAFKCAASSLIKANLASDKSKTDRPGRVRLSSGVVIEISGSLAKIARTIKSKLRSSRSRLSLTKKRS